jgi:ribosome biogenesis GTPase A
MLQVALGLRPGSAARLRSLRCGVSTVSVSRPAAAAMAETLTSWKMPTTYLKRSFSSSSSKDPDEPFDFYRPIVDHTTDGFRILTVNDEEAARLDDIVQGKEYTKKKLDFSMADTLMEEEMKDRDKKDAFLGEGEDGINVKKIIGFLELNPHVCHGCGSPFQSKTENAPGFLPGDKMADHQEQAKKIRAEQETIKLLQQVGYQVGSTASVKLMEKAKISKDIITSLNRFSVEGESFSFNSSTADMYRSEGDGSSASSAVSMREAKQMYKKEKEGYKETLSKCQRCFRLQQYGQINDSLRLGWSEHELLSPGHFQSLLKPISDTKAVVMCIVDVFDLQGSLLSNLREIAGDNPIVIAANKFDLLPKDVFKQRVHGWIFDNVKQHCNMMTPKEAEDMKYQQFESRGWIRPKERNSEEGILHRKNVHLISCQTGDGVPQLLKNIFSLAEKHGNKIYVMGAANVGKSSFINRLLRLGSHKTGRSGKSKTNSKKKDEDPTTTVSNLPGTTLNMLKIKLPNGITVIDTPGLINPGQLTTMLTPKELNAVIPAKPVSPVTFRAEEGKTLMIGALARIELVSGRPFNFTFFISNDILIRPVNTEVVDDFVKRHVGDLLAPPASLERLEALGALTEHTFTVILCYKQTHE